MYYNTTNEEGAELKSYSEKAETQKEKVLRTFKEFGLLTPSQAWKVSGLRLGTPLTSIRRAITDLTKEGKLIRTEEKKPGIYGRPESIYKLNQ